MTRDDLYLFAFVCWRPDRCLSILSSASDLAICQEAL